MRRIGLVLLFALGLGVGCAAGVAMQPQVAGAQAPEGVTRWEYVCDIAAEKKMNELGKQGWEGFGLGNNVVCFKRPLP